MMTAVWETCREQMKEKEEKKEMERNGTDVERMWKEGMIWWSHARNHALVI